MKNYITGRRLWQLWRDEFSGYNLRLFQRDLLAGITVAAVALPLALAFGVASGATAAAGLVTAVIAGIVIPALGGARFQISGPTGAMSAVLIVVAGRYGLEGVWLTGVLAGLMIILMGVLKWGQVINFIPSAVITGFTSGIAVIIFIGQIGNLLGIDTPSAENALVQLWRYVELQQAPNGAALGVGLLVVVTMAAWPKSWGARFPGSLAGLIAATAAAALLQLDVPVIGDIPQTVLLDDRLRLGSIPWSRLGQLMGPAASVALLGAIESLLCGAVIERQTGAKMDSVQELFAQGVGNMVVPFFGGVPATAAIARASVAVRSGAATRLTAIIHGFVLLAAALLLGPVISRVPLAALGGVLAVTAWRMNDWEAIRDIFRHRFRSEIFVFLLTLAATAVFDLTQAIVLGLGFSALIFVFQSSNSEVLHRPVSVEAMRRQGYDLLHDADRIVVVYVVGPLFFGTVHRFNMVLEGLDDAEDIILSLRTVPLIDTTGLRALDELIDRLEAEGRRVYLSGLARPVREKLERGGIIAKLGEERVFWSADQAIIAADRYRARQAGIQAG
ncbi:MAG: SulP family inorganic anion transporter [Limnochordales bacterium]